MHIKMSDILDFMFLAFSPHYSSNEYSSNDFSIDVYCALDHVKAIKILLIYQ